MKILLVSLFLITITSAQDKKFRLCASKSIREDDCYAVQRSGSKVQCEKVIDSVECAIRLKRGEADFAVLSAEELLLAYQFYPNDIQPIYQLRHKDRSEEEFLFQAVAVVPSDLSPAGPGRGFESLRDGGFCHPGFSKSQSWDDYILKYFERKTYNSSCQEDATTAENEMQNLSSFFGRGCRPGKWVSNDSYDGYLKKKFLEFCSLCDDPTSCSYNNKENHGHTGALECLKSGRGKVAYVALSHVRKFFQSNESFSFLCLDGSIQPLSTERPCAWIKQPWSAIVARKEISEKISNNLKNWLSPATVLHASEGWQISLKKILQGDETTHIRLTENTSLASYLGEGRKEIDFSNVKTCGKPIRWCTISTLENNKCTWIAKEALALGIEPKIECVQSNSTFQCFREISNDKADIITIDSNYGYLARKVYGLTTLMYSETAEDRNSVVVAVVREPKNDDFTVKSFYDLKGKTACFPEYGGIAWLSFVNIIRTNEIISPESCNYANLVSELLSGACTPGVEDGDHSNVTTRLLSTVSDILCSVCTSKRNDTSCSATEMNPYYGDKGALQCLSDAAGDVAFVEARNLMNDGTVDPNQYRLLCKNSSLALNSGFKFDKWCALSMTIDSEIVARKATPQYDIINARLALLKLEEWLGYRVNVDRPIRIYDKFNGTKDLLFKDSSSGLLSPEEDTEFVLAYKELFNHIEECTSGVSMSIASFSLVFSFAILSLLFSRH